MFEANKGITAWTCGLPQCARSTLNTCLCDKCQAHGRCLVMGMTDGRQIRQLKREQGKNGEFPLSADLSARAAWLAEMSPCKSKAYHIAGQTAEA